MSDLFERLAACTVYDLGQPYFSGMPHFPTHPPFLFGLTKKHGDYVHQGGASSAAESISLGGHVGTHIDALCHFTRDGKLHGGWEVEQEQSYQGGLGRLTIDTVAPILRPGVLLDAAGHAGMDALPADFEVTPALLDEVAGDLAIPAGGVVLLRTGWGRFFQDARRFLSEGRAPGPALAGARWLSERGIFAAGSDTIAFEKMPSPEMAVHAHLLVDRGIHIIECLNLEALAQAGVREFVFVACPLKITGGTGSPIRPLALA